MMRGDLYNKRGMAAIVTTVIIVALVLVAIGIIWVVINNVLQEGVSDIEGGRKCVDATISVTSASCLENACNMTLQRSGAGDGVAIGGVKLVFSDGTTSGSAQDVAGDIGQLATKSVNDTTLSDVGVANATTVDLVVYFTDSTGNEELCPGAATYNI